MSDCQGCTGCKPKHINTVDHTGIVYPLVADVVFPRCNNVVVPGLVKPDGTTSPKHPNGGWIVPVAPVPVTAVDTSTVDHTLTAGNVLSSTVKVSATAGNVVAVNADGLYVATPPTASVTAPLVAGNGPRRQVILSGAGLASTYSSLEMPTARGFDGAPVGTGNSNVGVNVPIQVVGPVGTITITNPSGSYSAMADVHLESIARFDATVTGTHGCIVKWYYNGTPFENQNIAQYVAISNAAIGTKSTHRAIGMAPGQVDVYTWTMEFNSSGGGSGVYSANTSLRAVVITQPW